MAVGLTLGHAPVFSASKKKRPKPAAESTDPLVPAAEVAKARPVRTGGPSVLFITVEGLNDWVGWMGGHPQARTPNMDRLAQSGMSFLNAHCAFSESNPSRTALLMGMWPWKSGVSSDAQDWRRSAQVIGKPSIPIFFRDAGFQTVADGMVYALGKGGLRGYEEDAAWDVRFPKAGVQLPEPAVKAGQNFNGLNLGEWDWGPVEAKDADMEDGKIAEWAVSFLQKQDRDLPFFLAVGFVRPQLPWYAPRSYSTERALPDVKLPEVKDDDLNDLPTAAKAFLKDGDLHKKIVEKNLWPSAVRAYLANVTFVDAQIGRVLDALEKSAHKNNTIIVLTSDHGESLGEKQRWGDGGLWERATRVPLIVVAPKVTQPATQSSQPVSLVDVYPTLCDLVALPKPAHLDGESLLALLKDPTTKCQRPALIASGSAQDASLAVRTDRYRYIVHHDGGEELYDHTADPYEWTNLARLPEQEATVKQLFSFVPQQWNSAQRKIAEVKTDSAADGSVAYWLQAGDAFNKEDAPDIEKHGLEFEIAFDYNPAADANGVLMSQGDEKLGYAIHLVEGKPAFTVNYDGLRSTLKARVPLPAGHIVLRALLGLDGTLAISAIGLPLEEVRGYTPMEGGFPRPLADGLTVAQMTKVLPSKVFPLSTSFDGVITKMRLSVLPGIAVETRAARAVPVE